MDDKASFLKVKNMEADTKEVEGYIQGLKKKQCEIRGEEKNYYSILTFYHALKYNIFFNNLLLHPLVLKKKNFYEEKKCVKTKKQIKELLAKVCEYEIMKDKIFLETHERDAIIQIYKKLEGRNKTISNEEKERNHNVAS